MTLMHEITCFRFNDSPADSVFEPNGILFVWHAVLSSVISFLKLDNKCETQMVCRTQQKRVMKC